MTTLHPSISRSPIPADGKNLATVCVLCSHNCAIRVDVEGGRIVEVRGDASSPITKGYLCNKAFSIEHYVDHAQRVRHPMRRTTDGVFERISWETAIAEIAAKLSEITAEHGPRSVAMVGIGGQANHLGGPYALGLLRTIGSRRWFCAFAQEKTQHLLMDQWMFDSSPATYVHADQKNAQFMLTLGTNPKISNRGHNATDSFPEFVKQGRTLVVVDPRETETTRGASRHLRVRPGSDAFLLLGLAATIVRENLVDEEFVRERTVGFETVREALAAVDVAEMARRSGLTTEDIVETARGFANAESAAVFYDLGVEQTRFSTLISYLIRVLLVLTGNLGRKGGNVFFETLLVPTQEPGKRRPPERALASGIPAIAALGNFGMLSPTLLPEEVMIDHPERLRAIIVEGANPLLSYSDTKAWLEARKRLDLVVVVEPAMTETAAIADYVLPAPTGYEKWEFANFPKAFPEVFLQVRPPVVPHVGEGLPEAEIYARIGEAMGIFGEVPTELHELARNALTPDGAMAYLAKAQELVAKTGDPRTAKERLIFWTYRAVGPYLPAPAISAIWLQCYLNAMMRFSDVVRALGDEWASKSPFEIGAELWRRVLAHPEGFELARIREETNLEDHVGFEDKKIRLAPEPMIAEISRAVATPLHADPDFPLIMAAGLRTRWTANTIHRDPQWRKGRGPHCALNLSASDAKSLGIAAGELVRVITNRSSAVMPAQIDAKLQTGHVWMPNGFGVHYGTDGAGAVDGINQNELTDVADRDPFTGIPHHRYVQCRIEKIARDAA